MTEEIKRLIERAATVAMSAADKEEQRRSFAFGNANIENERVTRAMIDAAAEKATPQR